MAVVKPRPPRRPLLILAALSLLVTVSIPAKSVPVISTPTQMLSKLSVKAESSSTYSRSSFRHWIDADGDSCNTRYEVLISESTKKVKISSKCKLTGGNWASKYDGVKTTDPSKFDVDHFVPLKEAWQSGAHRWNASTRTAFAND